MEERRSGSTSEWFQKMVVQGTGWWRQCLASFGRLLSTSHWWDHLWSTVQFLPSSYRKEVIKLKMVQKRFFRLLIELVGLSYREWLNKLGCFSLECRRPSGDITEMHKIMRGSQSFSPEYRNLKLTGKGLMWEPRDLRETSGTTFSLTQ